jgi:hypothetical protein
VKGPSPPFAAGIVQPAKQIFNTVLVAALGSVLKPLVVYEMKCFKGFQMEALMARFDLTDAEWTIIAPLLPGAEGRKNGRPRPDDRKVLNGIFFVLRTGTP